MLKFFAEKMWVAFAVQKLLTFFQQKISEIYIESAKTVNEMTLNELVKLTTLWTTGPCMSIHENMQELTVQMYFMFLGLFLEGWYLKCIKNKKVVHIRIVFPCNLTDKLCF